MTNAHLRLVARHVLLMATHTAGRITLRRSEWGPDADLLAAALLDVAADCGQRLHLAETVDGWSIDMTPAVA